MSPARPRFLLLQARAPGDPMAAHERRCFAATLACPEEDVEVHDLLGGAPAPARLDAVDALLVGGSGDFSVLDDAPWLRAFFDLLAREVVGRRRPTFASCFGFQALVVAGGGRVVHDAGRAEVGTFELHVTEAGRDDPLVGPLAPAFKAQLGHKDHADELPAGFRNLASSARTPYQAFRLEGLPVVATQFHPELDRRANTERYLRYWERYGQGDPADDPVLASMGDTPGASALLARWVAEELLALLEARG